MSSKYKAKQKTNTFPKSETTTLPSGKIIIRLSFLLFIFSFILYANTLHHGFVLDDSSVITENTMTQGGVSSLKEIFTTAYRAGYTNAENNLYRPLSKAMFAVEWQLSPDNPTIHHFMNILLYAIACVLLFYVLARWTKINVYVLFFSVLLFAAHPIHTEVVANIKSRDEILTMLFLLLSLNSCMNYLGTKRLSSLLAYLFYFFLALLSKESAIVFIALVPLFVYFFTGTPAGWNIRITLYAAAVAILSLLIHKSVIGSIGLSNIPVIDNSLLSTPNIFLQKATAILIMGKYLLLLLFPHPLSSDYSFDTIKIVSGAGDIGFLLALGVHLFLLVFAIRKFREKNILSFCILFYLVSMSIASNIFMTVGTHMAERLLFFPSIAFCLALAYVLSRAFKADITGFATSFKAFFASAGAFVMIAIVITLLYSFKSVSRNRDWKDNGTLFEKDMVTVPNSAHMLMYYTDYLIRKERLNKLAPDAKHSQLLKAKGYIEHALKIYELFPDAHYLYGRILYDLGDFEGAYKHYFRALSLNPGKAMYHNNAGTSLFALGRYPDAAKEFEQAMKLNPADADPPFNLGSAYGAMGEQYRQKNDRENALKMFNMAIPYFKKAIEMQPDYRSAYQFLGTTYMNMGDSLNGKSYLDKATRIKLNK